MLSSNPKGCSMKAKSSPKIIKIRSLLCQQLTFSIIWLPASRWGPADRSFSISIVLCPTAESSAAARAIYDFFIICHLFNSWKGSFYSPVQLWIPWEYFQGRILLIRQWAAESLDFRYNHSVTGYGTGAHQQV